jgi:two-component system, NtrC family, nitrogen regulation response regulator GlnG
MAASHLLIVDDDITIRHLLLAHLSSRGFDCSVAEDGRAALGILDSSTVDILLTDLEMPGMDGLTLLREVRERGLYTRCVVITGYATIANLTGCLREGACALIPKPFDDLSVLDRAVDQAVEQMQSWNKQLHAIIQLRPGRAHGT